MYIPESVMQNDTHKILWDSEIQMDPLISARRPDFVDIDVSSDHRVKLKESEKKDMTLDLSWELKICGTCRLYQF